MTQALLDHLGQEERSLLRRHGVRLRVDGITRDRRYALCSACQVRRPFFKTKLTDIALVAVAHRSFAKLNLFGMQTLISVVPKGPLTAFPAMDPHDPFQLHYALDAAAQKDAATKERMVQNADVMSTAPILEKLLGSTRTTTHEQHRTTDRPVSYPRSARG
ncbi:MAG: hypothetical protein IPL52_15230 [Flavobacteriales bacterium]|nr:hypothetical protein [Flavobacteriales bacterium]